MKSLFPVSSISFPVCAHHRFPS